MKVFFLLFLWVGTIFYFTEKTPSQLYILKKDFFLKGKTRSIQKDKYPRTDTIQEKRLLELSYEYIRSEDSLQFLKINDQAMKIASELHDSTGSASLYWDRGQYYYINDIPDKAFYYFNKAYLLYKALGAEKEAGRLLLNMAIIQSNIKDYTGSEITTIKAIQSFKELDEYYQLYSAYNNLGSLFKDLGEFEQSFFYYNRAEYYLEKSDHHDKFPSLWNNIGVAYTSHEQYELAIKYFERAIAYQHVSGRVKDTSPKLYAMLLDNLAYATQHVAIDQKKETILTYYHTALDIRKKVDQKMGMTINYLHMAEYFRALQDTVQAIDYAQKALNLSNQIGVNENYLQSLELLIDLDGENRLEYSQEFIKVSDSLTRKERTIRDKFTRILFETNEYMDKAEVLNQKLIWGSVIGIILIAALIFIFIYSELHRRYKTIAQKEIVNQEIYKLILEQQKSFEKGRQKEKNDISRELHDGILGKLFGLRLNLDILNEDHSEQGILERKRYIAEIKNIANEIRAISHRLNKAEFKGVNFHNVLEELIAQQNKINAIFSMEIDEEIDWEGIDNTIKINLFRILQEALSNIHKHAKATKATIQFELTNEKLILRITDNGVGISNTESSGIGLKNIKSRSKAIHGHITLRSNSLGTRLEVSCKL